MENYEMWINLIISIRSGLTVCIPLVIKLSNAIAGYIKEKNWNQLVKITMEYMIKAENLYSSGSEKKQWVLSMIELSATTGNFEYTEESRAKISDLIDNICDTSKQLMTK